MKTKIIKSLKKVETKTMDEDYDILARENKAMATALSKLGYSQQQISDICNGAI